MTIEEIKERLKAIETIKDDDEVAHILQDELYEDVLHAIAEGSENAKDLAIEALKVMYIDFARWFA